MNLSTLQSYSTMKQAILEDFIHKKASREHTAQLLGMHPNSVSRLKRRYLLFGKQVLVHTPPGPRQCTAPNRTPAEREQLVEYIACEHPSWGCLVIAEYLEDHHFRINATTVWRILLRRKVRYGELGVPKQLHTKLYALEEPGMELQFDASFPEGRARRIVEFGFIDDCSRMVLSRIYEGTENHGLARAFLSEFIPRLPFSVKRLRVDNRYGGKEFRAWCQEEFGIEVVVNPPYTPQYNGKIERYHKTMKREFIYRYMRWDMPVEEMNYRYQLWLLYYNAKRRHGGLGMNRMSPFQKITSTYYQHIVNPNTPNVTLSLQRYIIFSKL